jgi:3-oxoacyl-[acyl-carrier-protein] synthase II
LSEVVVTGIGLVSALGDSLEESWQNLIAGKSGILLHQPFAELPPTPLALIGHQPVPLASLTQQVVASALQDAGLFTPLPDCGVVIGSSRSNQAAWESLAGNGEWRQRQGSRVQGAGGTQQGCRVQGAGGTQQGCRVQGAGGENSPLSTPVRTTGQTPASDWLPLPPFSPQPPTPWLDTLPHMNAIMAARLLGATGIVLAPMAACATGIWALAQGFNLIQTGQCHRVIAGAVEAPITPLTLTGFQQMGALAKTGAYPFDIHREGLVLGEGAAVFVLESAALAKQRSAKVYGQILGFGLTSDAYHANAPDPEARSAIAAVNQCLERSHITPADIDYIHAHGTGTLLNDRIESFIIRCLFPHKVAVSSTKGATGHTLGASGALSAAFCLMALRQQLLPPTTGLQQPEFDLNFVNNSCPGEIHRVMCFSFGFGGQNAVLAIGKYQSAEF